MMTVARAWWFFSLFFQTLRWAGAAAPGDEDGACGVPEYSAGIEVLMDSWRYQSLLAESSSVWETETSERGPGSSDLVRKQAYFASCCIEWLHLQLATYIIIIIGTISSPYTLS